MSREPYEGKKGFSPAQRKACVVLALCALAIVLSILAAWVLPAKLGLFAGGAGAYDKDAYPLDTSLEAVLPQAAADDAYITASVFAGDQYAVTLQKDGRITLNQFVRRGSRPPRHSRPPVSTLHRIPAIIRSRRQFPR